MATSPNSCTAFAQVCNQHSGELVHFHTGRNEGTRDSVLQTLSKIQTSTQTFQVAFPPSPVELPFPSWVANRQGAARLLSERSHGSQAFPPSPRDVSGRTATFRKSKRSCPSGSRSEGGGTDPRPSIHPLLILAQPPNGPDTLPMV